MESILPALNILGFTGLYRVLLGFTEFYWVLQGLSRLVGLTEDDFLLRATQRDLLGELEVLPKVQRVDWTAVSMVTGLSLGRRAT